METDFQLELQQRVKIIGDDHTWVIISITKHIDGNTYVDLVRNKHQSYGVNASEIKSIIAL